jgi:hypothetical protein
MSVRQIIADLKQILPTILLVLAALAGAAAAIYFLPNSTAAVILGLIAALALSTYVLRGLQRTTQIAITWLSIGVVADAAYAKLNDQVPVTIAGALVKLVEAMVKLADILIRSIGIERVDARGRRFAWPEPMLPWQIEPARVIIDLGAWDELARRD